MDDEYVFNRVNISMLEEMIPEVKWGILLGYIFDYIGLSSEKMDLNIVLHCEKYLRQMVVLLNRTSHDEKCRIYPKKGLSSLGGKSVSIWSTMDSEWHWPSLYVKEEFGEELEDEVKSLITSLKQAFVGGIKHQTWLDSDTKVLCEEKVLAMTTKLGFPRYILDPVQLDTDYSGYLACKCYFDGYKPLNYIDWFVQPLVVNAFYEATGNAVIFPVGILRTPIFTPDRPKYLNYGMLGVVIGHEITHGFDNSGRKFDKVGNLTQWWSDEIVEKFKKKKFFCFGAVPQFPIDIVGLWVLVQKKLIAMLSG
ncbi:endothelin-converting enzyme 2 [Trichonephila inaurata madagascariensis]|uniref:Endothelin-converting enzyme 2 n=1 Tax=Trichonephila inaurata madagascariensis TaxID=2747483 RepID=A0A8X7BUS6_9ARAC|nr:endothelin-converting enzyme 2 [Trichonephila inaurata madagascariensis]